MPQVVRVFLAVGFCLLTAIASAEAETPVVTRHEIHVGETALSYKAEAGRIALRDGAGRITGQMFYVAYHRPPGIGTRPVVFLWTGAPARILRHCRWRLLDHAV